MHHYPKFVLIVLLFLTCQPSHAQSAADDYYAPDDFSSVKKIDIHVHINKHSTALMKQAAKDRFFLLTVNVNTPYYPTIEEQQRIALELIKTFPGQIAYSTAFDVTNWNDPNWQQKTLAYLDDSFKKGAIAVKVWKNIGMELRDSNGTFVMIDDKRFDPIIDFIEKSHKTLMGHLGEPKNAWLPTDQMTVKNDKGYFTRHPEYHMALHPEYPSYEDQINARNHMLDKHPNLRFVGVHLASLEWSVDELAKCLDKYPNMAVDMAARIVHLQYQSVSDWQKVHDFMIKYQDRLIYGTDHAVTDEDSEETSQGIHHVWEKDWLFFTSDKMLSNPNVGGQFRGLKLPKEVINKIYYANAKKWFPGI